MNPVCMHVCSNKCSVYYRTERQLNLKTRSILKFIVSQMCSYSETVKKNHCCCTLISHCTWLWALALTITSIVIFVSRKHELYTGIEWHWLRISNSSSKPEPQWLSFNPRRCPKDDQFYSQPYLIYLNARFDGRYDAMLTLTLKDYRSAIGSCTIPFGSLAVDGYKTCQFQVTSLDYVHAYILYSNDDESENYVEWGCSYFNFPYLITAIFISLCSCTFLSCCLHSWYVCVKSFDSKKGYQSINQ